jgi:hypothetical protein
MNETNHDAILKKVSTLFERMNQNRQLQELAENNGIDIKNSIKLTDDNMMNVAVTLVALSLAKEANDPRYKTLVNTGLQKRSLKMEIVNDYKSQANNIIHDWKSGVTVVQSSEPQTPIEPISDEDDIQQEGFTESKFSSDWNYVKPLKSIDFISEFENKFNFKFPSEFKAIVMKYNGGRPVNNTYKTSSKERTIKSFLSFNKDDKESIWNIDKYDWNPDNDLITKYIPFANDSAGNLICFKKKDKSIIFLDMETLKSEHIADDFSEFETILRTNDSNENSVYKIHLLQGMNSLKFGMSRNTVRNKLDLPFKEFKKTSKSDNTTDDYGKFHIYYDADDNFVAVELFKDAVIEINENKFSFANLDEILKSFGPFIKKHSYYINTEKSIGIYASDDSIESILFGKKGYYN